MSAKSIEVHVCLVRHPGLNGDVMLRFIRSVGPEPPEIDVRLRVQETHGTDEPKKQACFFPRGRWQIGVRANFEAEVEVWKTISVETATALLSVAKEPELRGGSSSAGI